MACRDQQEAMTVEKPVRKQKTPFPPIQSVVVASNNRELGVCGHPRSRSAIIGNRFYRDSSPPTTSTMSQSTSPAASISPTSSTSSHPDSLQKDIDHSTSTDTIHTLHNSYFSEPLQRLLIKYGRASHMGFQDPSYKIYLNGTEDGAIIYKILDRTAVISGDPLCPPHLTPSLLQDFRNICKQSRYKVAVVGASAQLARLAQQENFITMQFGTEKVINPATNPLLTGRGGGKRTIQKSRSLLKSGLTVETYDPSLQHDAEIEAHITRIYDAWRTLRNDSQTAQAYVTVYDLFFLPDIMTYLIVRDATQNRAIIGFAALRRYERTSHLDPVIASPTSSQRHRFEPLRELKNISGMPGFVTKGMRALHRHILTKLPLDGKKAFYQRFHPDEEQDGALHMIFFQQPTLRSALAMLHFANVDVQRVVRSSSTHLKQRIVEKGREMRERRRE
ncbi:hypothetical protein Q7P36_007072 [Cladosporium allicinum]